MNNTVKFQLLTEEVRNALALIAGIVGKEDTFQFVKTKESEFLKIIAKNEFLRAVINLRLENTKGDFPYKENESFNFFVFNVEAEAFKNIIKAMLANNQELLNFEINVAKEEITIKNKRIKSKIKYYISNTIEFPEKEEMKIFKNIGAFYKNILKVAPMAADNNPRPGLNAVLIDITPKRVNFVSTDTVKLAISNLSLNNEENISEPKLLLLPKKSIGFLKRAIEMVPESKIFYSEIEIGVVSDKLEIYTRLINDKFPSYKKIIPPKFEKTIKIKKENFLEILKEFSYITSTIKFSITKNQKIKINAYDSAIEAEAEIETEEIDTIKQFEKDIIVRTKNIVPFIQNIEGEYVYLGVNKETPPFKLSGEPKERYLQITMPLSL